MTRRMGIKYPTRGRTPDSSGSIRHGTPSMCLPLQPAGFARGARSCDSVSRPAEAMLGEVS